MKLRQCWYDMRKRCENPKFHAFHRYGGRGIKVCDEWKKYSAFFKWAKANGYREGLQIDRIDNDGDYCPSNCRFVGADSNKRNKSNDVFVTLGGNRVRLIDVCGGENNQYFRAMMRKHRGWPESRWLDRKGMRL